MEMTDAGPQYGPYHRLRSPTQDDKTARRQVYGGLLLGRAARWSFFPSVKAYKGPLPWGEDGIEFFSKVNPSRDDHPYIV